MASGRELRHNSMRRRRRDTLHERARPRHFRLAWRPYRQKPLCLPLAPIAGKDTPHARYRRKQRLHHIERRPPQSHLPDPVAPRRHRGRHGRNINGSPRRHAPLHPQLKGYLILSNLSDRRQEQPTHRQTGDRHNLRLRSKPS